jgi:hypothetical protein
VTDIRGVERGGEGGKGGNETRTAKRAIGSFQLESLTRDSKNLHYDRLRNAPSNLSKYSDAERHDLADARIPSFPRSKLRRASR